MFSEMKTKGSVGSPQIEGRDKCIELPRRQSLSLRTAILKSKPLRIAVGEKCIRQRRRQEAKQGRAAIVMPQAIKTIRADQNANWIFFGGVESGSREQTVTSNAYGANEGTRFARVGRTTKPLKHRRLSIPSTNWKAAVVK